MYKRQLSMDRGDDFLDKRKIIIVKFFYKITTTAETSPNDKPFTEELTTPQEYEYLMRYHCIVFVSNVLKIHWRKSYK